MSRGNIEIGVECESHVPTLSNEVEKTHTCEPNHRSNETAIQWKPFQLLDMFTDFT